MGIFNKLKNALFEEEEIEVDSTTLDKVVIKDEESLKPIIKKEEPIIKNEIPLENERELFKTNNTFNFPDFDEEEFVTNYEPPFEPPQERETRITRKIEPEKVKREYSQVKPKITQEKTSTRRKKDKTSDKINPIKKGFKPSPIISPVYGVLDKNYKKEDIISVKHNNDKIIDVDMARKKAFGKLDEPVKIYEEPLTDYYNDDSKSIDELLNETIDDTIEIKYEEPNLSLDNLDNNDNIFTNDLEEELNQIDDSNNFEEFTEELPKIDKQEEQKKENSLEDTLESDLFDLIDSMYDDREEE